MTDLRDEAVGTGRQVERACLQNPSSVIWTEDWRGAKEKSTGYVLEEEWSVDASLYPDFPALANELHDEGFAFYVYFNPFIYEGSKAYAEAQPKGLLVKHPDGSDYLGAMRAAINS